MEYLANRTIGSIYNLRLASQMSNFLQNTWKKLVNFMLIFN